ncbi:MAG: hypothetical protein RL685_876 [Pseudomonadota bacterium]|jgi:hypothetical protein
MTQRNDTQQSNTELSNEDLESVQGGALRSGQSVKEMLRGYSMVLWVAPRWVPGPGRRSPIAIG